TSEQVVFANGDRVPLDPKAPLKLANDRLSFRPLPPLRAKGEELSPPLASVAVVWLAAPEGAEEPALFLRQLIGAHRARDVVLLKNGDAVEGTLTALDRESGCRVVVRKKPVEIPFARVAAVALNSELLSRTLPRGPYGHLVLTGSCRLSLASAQVETKG